MRRHRRGGLLVTLGLAAGGLLVATNPGVPALASGQVCAGIVIDDGTGAAPLTQGASVPPGSSDLDLLEAAGDSFKQVDSGLVCVINGYPVNGVQNCLEADHGLFYYWSYWEGDATTNTWTYANVGPAEHTVDAGQSYVEGWRYQDPGPDTPAAAKPSETPAAAFAQACQSAPPTTTTTTTTTPGGRRGGRHPGATSAAPLPAPPTTATRRNRPRETESHLGRPGCDHVHDHDTGSQRTGCRRSLHLHDFDVHHPEPSRNRSRHPSSPSLVPLGMALQGQTPRCPSSSWRSSSRCWAFWPGSGGGEGRPKSDSGRRSPAPLAAPGGVVVVGGGVGGLRHADEQPVPLGPDRSRCLLRRVRVSE